MACKRDIVGDDYVVSEGAVMGDVRVCHNKAVRSNDGFGLGPSASMYRHPLADAVIRSDMKEASAVDESEILRLASEDRSFVNGIGGPERRKPLDHCMSANIAALPNLRITLDNRVRSDAHACGELS